MDNEDKKKPVLKFSVDEQVANGFYVNFTNISHSPTEFVLDFARVVPGRDTARILTRVITNPTHAKQILRALQANMEMYEKKFGRIAAPEDLSGPIN